MLDNRIYTFLTLCDKMNYRITANTLSMTQPAVTQHIKSLERDYGCKLFSYHNRKLSLSAEGELLQRYARASLYNETLFKNSLSDTKPVNLKIGATKTIGNYSITSLTSELLNNNEIRLSIFIDNTKKLLTLLDNAQLDFAIIEGFFDKEKYSHHLMEQVEFVGICPKNHYLAGKVVPIESLKDELLIVREPGSGTRAIFEQQLAKENLTIRHFNRICDINSFELIKRALKANNAITFAYKTIADSDDELTTFYISRQKIYHEFNFVYLKNSLSSDILNKILNLKA